jgi:hypothetical protein
VTVQEALQAYGTAATTKKLKIIAFVLAELDSRLATVLQGIGTNPDEPTVSALLQIRSTASTIITRVDQKLPAPVPTPPPDIG